MEYEESGPEPGESVYPEVTKETETIGNRGRVSLLRPPFLVAHFKHSIGDDAVEQGLCREGGVRREEKWVEILLYDSFTNREAFLYVCDV